MPTSFLPFSSFVPDGGAHGSEMSLIQNALPVHRGFRPLQQKTSLASVADGPVTGAFVHLYQQSAQVQKTRPSADTTPGSWLPSTGAALYAQVNEQSADDVGFIFVANAPSSAAATLALTAINSVVPGTNAFLRWRYRVPVAAAGTWTMKAELMEGATVRATDTVTGTATATYFTQRQYNLTSTEANAIVNYAGLSIRLTATVPGTAATLLPSSDAVVGGWTTNAGATTNLYTAIDEASPSDADYAQSPVLASGGATSTYSANLSAGADPLTRAGFVWKYRYRATNAGVTVKARLKQGSTVVKEVVHAGAGTSFAENDVTLSSAEAAAITDFTTLAFEAEASLPSLIASTQSQFGRPSQDITVSGWIDQGAGTTNIWQGIDEATPAVTTDYINCGNPAGSTATFTYETKLTAMAAPGRTDGITFRIYAVANPSFPSGQHVLAVYLMQGATAITLAPFTLTGSYATYSYTLVPFEVNQITDWTDLRLRFVWTANGNAGNVFVAQAELEAPVAARGVISWAALALPSASRGEVSWVEFQVPDAAAAYKGDVPTLIAGTPTKLYGVDQTGFADLSKGGGYGSGSPAPAGWWIRQAGPHVIATNYTDPVQYRANNTGSFADLITSTEKPKARFCDTVRNQLALADVVLAGATYSAPDGITLSATDNYQDFHPAATTSCFGAVVRAMPGQIMGLVGGDNGTIFKRNSLHALLYTGDSALPYRVDTISNSHGTPFPRSIVRGVGAIYWWNGDGFARLIEGGYPEAIGGDMLTAYLTDSKFSDAAILNRSPSSYAEEDQMMVGWRDPVTGLLFWHYRSVPYSTAPGVNPQPVNAYQHQRIVVLNPANGEFTVLQDTNFNVAYACSLPNAQSSDQHVLRGSYAFDYIAGTTTWFKWSSGNTYQARFHVKRQAIALDNSEKPVNVRVTGVMPVFTALPAGTIPLVSVTGTTSNDPLYVPRTGINPNAVTYTQASADEWGVYPFSLEGRWFDWDVTVPDLMGSTIAAFKGLYIVWEARG